MLTREFPCDLPHEAVLVNLLDVQAQDEWDRALEFVLPESRSKVDLLPTTWLSTRWVALQQCLHPSALCLCQEEPMAVQVNQHACFVWTSGLLSYTVDSCGRTRVTPSVRVRVCFRSILRCLIFWNRVSLIINVFMNPKLPLNGCIFHSPCR